MCPPRRPVATARRHRARWLALLAGLLLGRPAAADDPPLCYAVIADVQKPDGDPLTDFRWAVAQVNALRPDFLLLPGDLTNTGTLAQYAGVRGVLDGCAVPWFAVPGNHDAVPGEAGYRARFTAQVGQPPWAHHVVGGWHLFLLDTSRFVGGKLQHDGEVGPEQLAWLRAELREVPAEAPLVLAAHHPFAIRADGCRNAAEVLGLFAGHRLRYTVTGHFHRNHHVQDVEGVHHLVTSSIAFAGDQRIGYRLISTFGPDLWTAWIGTTDPPVWGPGEAVTPGEVTVPSAWPLPAPGPGRLDLRLRYEGGPARLTLTGRPPVTLPRVEQPATVLLPLDPAPAGSAASLLRLDPARPLRVTTAALLPTTATWQHHRLRAPGEVFARVTLHAPAAGATLPRGAQPILALVEAPADLPVQLVIDGQPVTCDPSGHVAVVFRANGLQGHGHGFLNHLYCHGELVCRLLPDRDVTEWEQLAFALPRALWDASPQPSFTLTAGTTTDGSGADPPENNEDYQVAEVFLFDGTRCLRDPGHPDGVIAIGDNGRPPATRLVTTPTAPHDPGRLHVLLHTWDTTRVAPGRHTVALRVGDRVEQVTVTIE